MYAVLCSCCGKGVTCFKINKSNMIWDSLVIAIDYKINILDYFDYIKLCLILSNKFSSTKSWHISNKGWFPTIDKWKFFRLEEQLYVWILEFAWTLNIIMKYFEFDYSLPNKGPCKRNKIVTYIAKYIFCHFLIFARVFLVFRRYLFNINTMCWGGLTPSTTFMLDMEFMHGHQII